MQLVSKLFYLLSELDQQFFTHTTIFISLVLSFQILQIILNLEFFSKGFAHFLIDCINICESRDERVLLNSGQDSFHNFLEKFLLVMKKIHCEVVVFNGAIT